MLVDDCAGGFCIETTVESNDAAECRFRVSVESSRISIVNIIVYGNATWIGVFNNNAGGLLELLNAFQRRIGIAYVVIGKGLAL